MVSVSIDSVLFSVSDASVPVAMHGGRAISGQTFVDDTLALAGQFAAHSADTWGLYFDDAYPFATALFAMLRAGKTVVIPGNNALGTQEQLLKHCDEVFGEFSTATTLPQACPLQPAAIDQTAKLIVFTSGSSGEPKLIAKRWCQLSAEVSALEKLWGHILNDCEVFSTVSHQHLYGLLFWILWPLACGRTMVSHRFRDPESVLENTETKRDFYWIASPAQLKRISPQANWTVARRHLKAIFSSGGPLPAENALQICGALGAAPIEVYGSSESGGIAWRQHGLVTRWQTLPGVEIGSTESGALRVRSAHLPDSQWLEMADQLRSIDNNGFELGPRLDRIVKIEEKRVSLPEIESRLRNHEFVHECYAVALETERQQIGVIVVPSAEGTEALQHNGKTVINQQLRRYLGHFFEAIAVPRRWRYVETLPMNSQGKCIQRDLRALFEDAENVVLPRVISSEVQGTHATLQLEIPENLAFLPGHFPGSPVLPGVVQIGWAESFGRALLNLEGRFKDMETLKFKKLIVPPCLLTLELDYHPGKAKLHFSFRSAQGDHSSGKLCFRSDV